MSGKQGKNKYRGAKNPVKTLGRLLSYAFSGYKAATFFVVLFVILSSAANVLGASRFAPIITELTKGAGADIKLIYTNVIIIACIYVVGVLSAFGYNRIMMYIAQ